MLLELAPTRAVLAALVRLPTMPSPIVKLAACSARLIARVSYVSSLP